MSNEKQKPGRKRTIICPRCNKRDKVPGQSYCQECVNRYAREHRAPWAARADFRCDTPGCDNESLKNIGLCAACILKRPSPTDGGNQKAP